MTSPFSFLRARKSATPSTTRPCSASRRSLPPCRTPSRPSCWPAKATISARASISANLPIAASRKASHIRAAGIAPSSASSSAKLRWWRCCTARWAVAAGGSKRGPPCNSAGAETSAYSALPEGGRGIFVGGGGSVRLPRLIGTARMMDMMLTGRTYGAEEGQAIGISHYLVPAGAGLAKGIELAKHIAGNAPMTNFAVTHVLPRIAAPEPAGGYVTEALISAIAQGDDEAKARLKAFLEKRAPKTVRN